MRVFNSLCIMRIPSCFFDISFWWEGGWKGHKSMWIGEVLLMILAKDEEKKFKGTKYILFTFFGLKPLVLSFVQ